VFGIYKPYAPKTQLTEQLKIKEIFFNKPPLEVFSKLYNHYENAYILESIEGPKKLSQYSFIGFNPELTITIKNGEAVTHNLRTEDKDREKTDEPLSVVAKTLQNRPGFMEQRFFGGAVGYISYDAVRCWEKIPKNSLDDQKFPDIKVGIFDDGIIYDHRSRQAFYYYLHQNRLEEINKKIQEQDSNETVTHKKLKVNMSKDSFEDAVQKAKEYVKAGDIFQVVLSKRYDFQIEGNLIGFYRNLRKINPSPYMYFLADPKERAEHVMLVDLGRNDIGKVSKYGSVHLPEFMKVHQYSHVQHIVSRVVGNLRDEYDAYDALKAVFPAGTVSGAPKVRAMEIIEELEPTRRGPYAGAVGYFSYNGNADFAITIRTLVANKDKAHIQVGAGIVADSDPEREWFETEHKARALIKALEMSGSENK